MGEALSIQVKLLSGKDLKFIDLIVSALLSHLDLLEHLLVVLSLVPFLAFHVLLEELEGRDVPHHLVQFIIIFFIFDYRLPLHFHPARVLGFELGDQLLFLVADDA